MILSFALANLADLLTFLLVVQTHPIAGESNPLIRMAYIRHGELGVIALKVALVAIVIGITMILPSRLAQMVLWIGVGVALLGALVNTVSGTL